MTEVRNFTVLDRASEPDEPDQYGNISYWLRLDGVEKNALIRHKKDKPLKNGGDVIEGYYLEEKKSQAGKDYLKLTRPQQQTGGGGGGGGWKGKTPEERAQDRANSSVIRAYEYFLIPADQRPPLREYLETAGKIHTALQRLETGQVALEA